MLFISFAKNKKKGKGTFLCSRETVSKHTKSHMPKFLVGLSRNWKFLVSVSSIPSRNSMIFPRERMSIRGNVCMYVFNDEEGIDCPKGQKQGKKHVWFKYFFFNARCSVFRCDWFLYFTTLHAKLFRLPVLLVRWRSRTIAFLRLAFWRTWTFQLLPD